MNYFKSKVSILFSQSEKKNFFLKHSTKSEAARTTILLRVTKRALLRLNYMSTVTEQHEVVHFCEFSMLHARYLKILVEY